MKTKKILSILLVILLMFSFCSFSTYAADGTENIQSADLDLSVIVSDGEGNNWDVASSVTSGIWEGNPYPEFAGMRYYRIPNSEIADTVLHFVYLTEPLKLTADHEYELDFSYGTFYALDNCIFAVGLVYYDSAGNEIKDTCLYQKQLLSDEPVNVNFSFKLDTSDIESGYTCKLQFNYLFGGSFDNAANAYYFISDEIGFVDKDDDSGWFQKIINKIEETINNIKAIPDKIGAFFTQLGEDIKGFFEMLKNYLLYFQHPVTLNSEGVLVDENGEPIYTNPFESALSDVEETVNGWIADIKQFIEDMDESRIEVSGYLETGTGFINDIMSAHPIISVCVIFAAAFFVIRKVVGR